MSIIDQLIAAATTVRNEQKKEANTSIRIGDLFLSIINYFNNLIKNIGSHHKGYKSTIAKLLSDEPIPTDGDYAYVGETGTIWEVENGEWIDSGKPIPEDSLNLNELERLESDKADKVNENGDQVVYSKDGKIPKSGDFFVIDVNGTGDYTSIQECITAKGKGVSGAPVKMFLMPGMYKSRLRLQECNIILIGYNKHNTIVWNDTGDYLTPPAEISGNIYIENVQFFESRELMPNPTITKLAYAVHMDYAGSGTMELNNCILKSHANYALGVGLWKDQTLILRNSDIICTSEVENRGALYIHDSLNPTANTNLRFESYNCTYIAKSPRVLSIDFVGSAATDMSMLFVGNTFITESDDKTNMLLVDTPANEDCISGYIKLDPGSHGNNIEQLNADRVNSKSFVNVSQLIGNYGFENKNAARISLSVDMRTLGQTITYKLSSGRWITEQFFGSSLSEWNSDANWRRIIDSSDVDFIEEPLPPSTESWFNADAVTHGVSLSNNNGAVVSNPIAATSDYIPITKGDKVIFNSDRVVAFYDTNKALVAYLKIIDEVPSQDKRILTITNSYSYMRFTILEEWLDSTYCYINYDPDESGESANLFDKNNITPNKALNGNTGAEAAHTSASISNYTPAVYGNTVTFNSDRVVAFYNANKVLLSFISALDDVPSQEERVIHISEKDCAFVRFTIMNTWLDTTYCYVNSKSAPTRPSGIPTTKIIHEVQAVDKVFEVLGEEVFVDANEVILQGKRLPEYLNGLSYNPSIHSYDLRKDITNAAILSDNTIIAAIGDKIVKYGFDGVEEVLLEINTVSDWRCVWQHSSGNVFFSPMNSYTNGTDVSNYGLYKYDGTSVTKVIQLANRQCIWGIDEDKDGNIYAGVYSLGDYNTDLYKSTDNGDSFTLLRNWAGQKHIHTLYVDKITDFLYISIGDTYAASQNFMSVDQGISFMPCIDTLKRQMTAIISSSKYRFFGTDHSPEGIVYRTSDDDILEKSLDVGYYSNVFFLRKSDLTGWIYAGFKTDPSATSNLFCSIWVTKDDGDTWQEIKTLNSLAAGEGFWFASNFKDGNMIVGYKYNNTFKGLGISELVQPIYSTEGIVGTIIKPLIF